MVIALITDYEIRGRKGEETLYLYLEFDTEFGKLKSGEKRKKLDEIIGDFLKEKNIKFDGKKIAVISGGLLVATLMLKAPNMNYNAQSPADYGYQSSVVLMDGDVEIDSPILEKRDEMEIVDKEDVVAKSEIEEKSKGNEITSFTKDNSIGKVTGTNNNAKENTTNASQSRPSISTANKPTVPSSSSQTSKPSSTTTVREPSDSTPPSVQEAPIDNNVYVTVNRTNGTVLKLELEEYVTGVVGAEMPAAFNREALKAQAVIARTYAMRAVETGRALTDNSSTQNYKSVDQLRAMWGTSFDTYYQKVKNAVLETKGVYLTYNNVIIDAVYHSTSNGRTEDAQYVWGNAFPYLVSVESPYDELNSSFTKTFFLSYADVSAKLGVSVTYDTDIEILSKTMGNRVERIAFGEKEFTGVTVRNKLGLRSADFDVAKSDAGLTFTTRGYGHGVGLSQYGANGMANHGYDYASILKHYYRGVNLSHL